MRIVTFYQSSNEHIAQIKSLVPKSEVVVATPESLSDDLINSDIFFGHVKASVDWDAVVNNGRLKWIQSSAAGLDHCLNETTRPSSIVVSSASGVFADQVAEQTMALLLSLLRNMNVFIRAQLKHEYVRRPTDDLHGKSIGIIGAGGNGQRIAEVLQPFRNRIIATDHFADQKLAGIDRLLPPHQLPQLLEQSDVVIVTVPLLKETFHLVGKEQLALMPKSSYLINVARGETVDESALIKALASNHLAGAGLDVAEVEPLPADSPLWDNENVVISPHVGAQSQTRNNDVTNLFCENLTKYNEGQLLTNQIDKQLGFPRPEQRWLRKTV